MQDNSDAGKAVRHRTFAVLLRYAATTKQLELLQPYLAQAGRWAAAWGLSADQLRPLFLQVAEALEKAGEIEESQAFLIRYLSTFEGADAATLAQAREYAKGAAINYVRAPGVSQRSNLPHLAAVRALPRL
jgi:hypothetical protein